MIHGRDVHYYQNLEKLCKRNILKNGYVPYLYWTSETYSFGKIFRQIIGWNRFLQIPFTSDHGVFINLILSEIDLESESKFHLTWNEKIIEKYIDYKGKTFIHIESPWVTYRRKNQIKRKANARGTIAFVPHTISNVEIDKTLLDNYIIALHNLPERFKPVTLCLSSHDVNKKLHNELSVKYEFKIVTAGNPNRTDYVDRWYDLVSNFKYGVSNTFGTQIPYLVEMGIPCSLIGEPTLYTNYSAENSVLPLGTFNPYFTEYALQIAKKFKGINENISHDQIEAVNQLLGIGKNIGNSPEFRKELKWELVSVYLKKLFKFLKLNDLPRRMLDRK
jgi:hypothetical protein